MNGRTAKVSNMAGFQKIRMRSCSRILATPRSIKLPRISPSLTTLLFPKLRRTSLQRIPPCLTVVRLPTFQSTKLRRVHPSLRIVRPPKDTRHLQGSVAAITTSIPVETDTEAFVTNAKYGRKGTRTTHDSKSRRGMRDTALTKNRHAAF